MRMFLRFFGRSRDPATLSQRDWDRFIRARRAGRIGPSGKPVSDRTVEYDLKLLIAVLNWAVKSRDEQGRLLLDRNPLRGLRTPTEKNPTRVVLTEDEYRALLKVSRRVDWRFYVALVLAHETGHRIGASSAGGRRPRRCFGAISGPTRDSFGRLWKTAAGLAPGIVCGRPQVGKPGFRTESVAIWSGTVVCPAS